MANLWHAELLETAVPGLNETPKMASVNGFSLAYRSPGDNSARVKCHASSVLVIGHSLWRPYLFWNQHSQGLMPRFKGSNHWQPFGIQICPGDNSARVKCHA